MGCVVVWCGIENIGLDYEWAGNEKRGGGCIKV